MESNWPTAAVRLLPARPPVGLKPLDASAQHVADAVHAGKNLVVLGGPGTGKTNLALSLLAQAVEEGRDALLLAPTRRRADALRARAAQVTAAQGAGAVRVRTPASFAFSIVATSAQGRPDPLPAPVLLMGAAEDAALAALVDPCQWAPLPPEAVATPAFRTELRNLLARCGELGVSGEELAALGQRFNVPIWRQASGLVKTWDEQGRPRSHNRSQVRLIDSVRIQDRAVEALESWDRDGVTALRPIPELIIVDDYQDCTHATARMLTELATPGRDGLATQVVVLGNPDVAVETFRGGAPSLLVGAVRDDTLRAERFTLRTHHRGGMALHALWADQEQRIPVMGSTDYRIRTLARAHRDEECEQQPEASEAALSAPVGVTALVARSPEQEAAHISRVLRGEHVHSSTPWDAMAVIVRSSGQCRAMVRELRRRGVPVTTSQPAVLLRSEPAAAALLQAAQASLNGRYGSSTHQPDEVAVSELLSSPLVGLSALDLRRLRRRLRQGFPDGGPAIPTACSVTQLACDEARAGEVAAFLEPESIAPQAKAVLRAARMIAAARLVVEGAQAGTAVVDCEELLWALWDHSERGPHWRAQALAIPSVSSPGTAMLAEAAEHHLDVVTALFKRAEVWAERHPGSGAQDFLDELERELLPSDSVAPQGVRPAGVSVLTASAAVGSSWDVVVVAGIQRDLWPDLRVRDSLTRSGWLVDVVSADRGFSSGSELIEARDVMHEAAREQVRADERRMFMAAISRARRRLILSAYSTVDSQPSAFFFEACRGAGIEILDAQGQVCVSPEVGEFTLRGLVGQLRRAAVTGMLPQASPAERQRAEAGVSLLARLAREGIPGAAPTQWQDVNDYVSAQPLVPAGTPVQVSPSDVESLVMCPLRWFLERNGASGAPSEAQQLGTALHALAEEGQRNGRKGDHVREGLDSLIETMNYPDTTVGRGQADRARRVGERLATYLDSVPGQVLVEIGVDAVLTVEQEAEDDPPEEQKYPQTLATERVRIKGRIDRLELLDSVPPSEATASQDSPAFRGGRGRIIDIKTGKSAYAHAERNPQLAAYRLALQELGYEVDGAALVLLGQEPPKKNLGMPVLSPRDAVLDPSPDEEGKAWDRHLLFEAARAARGPLFEARTNVNCRFCRVKDCCPLEVSGGSVVE